MDALAELLVKQRRELSWLSVSVELKVDELNAKRALFALAPRVAARLLGGNAQLHAVFNGPGEGGGKTLIYSCKVELDWPPTALSEVYSNGLDGVFVQALVVLPDPTVRSADESFHDVQKNVADALVDDQLYIAPFASRTLCKLQRRTLQTDVKMAVDVPKQATPPHHLPPPPAPKPTPVSPPHKKPRKALFPTDEQTTPLNLPSQAHGGPQPPKLVSELTGGKLTFKAVEQTASQIAPAMVPTKPTGKQSGTLDSFFSRSS